MTQILDPDMQDAWDELEKEADALLRVVRVGRAVIGAYRAWPEELYGEVGELQDIYFEAFKKVEHLL